MPQKVHTSNRLPLNLLIEKKSQTRFFLIFGLLLICVNSLLLKPLSIFFNNDVLFYDGFLPYLMELLILICDILFYTATFTAISYALCFFGRGRHLAIGYLGLYALGALLDIGMTVIIRKSIPLLLFFEIGLYFLLSLVFLVIFYWVIAWRIKTYKKRQKELAKAKAILSKKTKQNKSSEELVLYPFAQFFSLHNPLQWCAFVVSILLALPFLIPNFIQIFEFIPKLPEVLKAIALFLAYALLPVISYFASLLLFAHFFKVKERVAEKESAKLLEE